MGLERRAVPFPVELLDLLSLHSRVSSLASEDSSFSDRSAPTSAKNFLLRLVDQLSFPPQRCDWPGARMRSFGSGAHWLRLRHLCCVSSRRPVESWREFSQLSVLAQSKDLPGTFVSLKG